MSGEEEKCKHYAGLLVLLQQENLLSMALYMDFKKAMMRGCDMNGEEVERAIEFAENNLNFDVSCVYWEYK
jgi:hypothetical protein|tara:strand:+ start:435 stop:647 length:213 start_codon:yes stop_codon:yes gene_type:complete